MHKSPIDFYIQRVEKIVEEKLKASRREAFRVLCINFAIVLVGLGILFVLAAAAHHYFIKEARVITEIKEVETVIEKEVFVDKVIEKKIIREVNNPIVLRDGTTVFRNGTIITKDGSVIADIDDLVADISDAIGAKAIEGVTHYSLFVEEAVKTSENKSVAVTTGYSFDLTADTRHPKNQWCYYGNTQNTSKYISRIGTNPYKVIQTENLSNIEKNELTDGCKWLTPKVTSHFVPVDERGIAASLKGKVEKSLSLFEKNTGLSTKDITINYGRFDQPQDEDVLGTCFLNGTEMQISIEKLESASNEFVSAVVFHELGHCLLGLEHTADETNIMAAQISDELISRGPVAWAGDLERK